jgi:hypothetical protein
VPTRLSPTAVGRERQLAEERREEGSVRPALASGHLENAKGPGRVERPQNV